MRTLQLCKVFRMVFKIWLTLIYGLKKTRGKTRPYLCAIFVCGSHFLRRLPQHCENRGILKKQKLLEVSGPPYLY